MRNLSATFFFSHLKLTPCQHPYAELENRKKKKGKKRKAAVEASTSSKISTAWKGRVPSTQARHSALPLRGEKKKNVEKCLQPLIDTSPCFSFLSHQNFQRSIFLGLTRLPAAGRLTQAALLPWASSHMLHFSGKAPKKILT